MEFLHSLANSGTDTIGDHNFVFKYNDDKININETNQDKRLVDELDENAREFVIECYEIKASAIWDKEIIVKNATKRNLKIEVSYPTQDFGKEKDKV